jgi:hypothetical protein
VLPQQFLKRCNQASKRISFSALEIDILHPPIFCVPADKRQKAAPGSPGRVVSAFAAAVPAISHPPQARLACKELTHNTSPPPPPSPASQQHRQHPHLSLTATVLLANDSSASPTTTTATTTPAFSTTHPGAFHITTLLAGPVSPKQPPRSSSCTTNNSLS